MSDNTTAPACPPDVNALILSQLDVGSTIGVGFLGVAISSAYVSIAALRLAHGGVLTMYVVYTALHAFRPSSTTGLRGAARTRPSLKSSYVLA